jgi:phosphatidate cytidylyltransferase
MSDGEIAWRAALAWLLFPAIAIPLAIAAKRTGHRGFAERLVPWLVIVPVAFLGSFAGTHVFAAILVACAIGVGIELDALLPASRSSISSLPIVAAAALPTTWCLFAMRSIPDGVAAAVIGASIAAICFASPAGRWSLALVGLVVGVGLAYWLRLEREPFGFGYVLVVFSAVFVVDSVAFAAGRLVGGPHPFKRVSPGKTVVGYASGVAGALFTLSVMSFAVADLSWTAIVQFSFVVAIAASAGDLAASALKRRYGVKDFGTLLGPQGGLLDRLDSLVAAGWASVLWLEYVVRA